MFLLVPAHPGFPGQIPQSRKTVVCVCVCVNVVSSDIRVMQIFAGVREIWGVKQESGHLRCMISLHNAVTRLPSVS